MTAIFEQCGRCNATVDASAKYCPRCGAALSTAQGDGFVEQSKHYLSEAADELVGAARDGVGAVRGPSGKKIAAGAAIGALVGIPLIGPVFGAMVGGGIVAMRHRGGAEGTNSDDQTPVPTSKPKPRSGKKKS